VKEPIRKVVLADGSARFRLVVDTPRDPATGKRRQITRTFGKRKDARAELARIRHQTREGTYVPASRLTVDGVIDGFLTTACYEKAPATARSYQDAFRCARLRLGSRLAQSVTRADGEDLRAWMLADGRKRGGKAGTGLSTRSVQLALGRLTAAFDQAVDDGQLARNPFRGVKPPKSVRLEKTAWSEDEARAFLAEASRDRLAAAWQLSLNGLRREECLGLRWAEDVDLDAATVTVASVRVLVAGRVHVQDCPKSERGARTLPLDASAAAGLAGLHARQAAEKLAAGPAWRDSGYVVTDELGEPVDPAWFSAEFLRVVKRAGIRRITLHEARHTAASLMEKAGVPASIAAAWCGHTVAVNKSTYVHALPGDLAVARDTLAGIYKIG
jgi:integrase